MDLGDATNADFVEMYDALNPPEDPLEILERDLNDADYFQVLACPQLEDQGNHYGVAIRKTTRTDLASRTDYVELININTTQSDASGTLVSDPYRTRIDATLTISEFKESDVSDEVNSNNKSSLTLISTDAVTRKDRRRNESSVKKSGQSTVHRQKNHKCNFCQKVCLSSVHLEIHIRVHTQEKPYKCPSCQKSFSELSKVHVHKRIHSSI